MIFKVKALVITVVMVLMFTCFGVAFAEGNSNVALINKVYELAKIGKTIESANFHLGVTAADIKKAWGEEDIYPTQDNRLIYLNPEVIFGLDCNKEKVRSITQYRMTEQFSAEEIKQVLGEPDIEKKYNKNYDYTVHRKGDYTLEYYIDPTPNHVDSPRYILSFKFSLYGYDGYTLRHLKE